MHIPYYMYRISIVLAAVIAFLVSILVSVVNSAPCLGYDFSSFCYLVSVCSRCFLGCGILVMTV